MRESVNEGSSLAAALDQHRRVFSSLFINMVRAGEASGALPIVLLRLADFSEHQLDTRKRITSKMYYPLFMVAIGSLVLLALLTYVVPTVTTVFANMRQTLPWPTVVLIAVSGFYGPVAAGHGIVCMVYSCSAIVARRVARNASIAGKSAPQYLAN